LIQPTVGKRLWYWPTRAGAIDNYDLANQPLAAFITCVNMDGTVNIAYLDRNGAPDCRITIQLWQPPSPRPMGGFCEYHPDDMQAGAIIDHIKVTAPIPEPPRPKLTLPKKS
jgi:hypothetical protein